MLTVLGIDAGNYRTKTIGPEGPDAFRSALASWVEGEERETFGADDMTFSVDGRRGLAGTVASYEDEFGGVAMFGNTKAHDDAKVRVLIACARYRPRGGHFRIVVGQPIKRHTESEKKAIRALLLGTHEVAINGQLCEVVIDDVSVARESASAYVGTPLSRTMRVLDVGSGTVGAASIVDGRFINSGSGTFDFGTETVRDKSDLGALALGAIRNTTALKWQTGDLVGVCGGSADKVFPFVKQRYENAQVIRPSIQTIGGGIERLHPSFANAAGFYAIARQVYL